jgi:hypothetical protein
VGTVFLYGSYAKRTAKEESDNDQPFASEEIVLMQELTAKLDLKTHLLDFIPFVY